MLWSKGMGNAHKCSIGLAGSLPENGEEIVSCDAGSSRCHSASRTGFSKLSCSCVCRLPDITLVAQGKGPLVASPAGGTPLELASSVPAAKPLSLSLLAGYSPDIVESQPLVFSKLKGRINSWHPGWSAGGGTGGSAGSLALGCSSGLSRRVQPASSSGTPSSQSPAK
eukprot:5687579-Amphidinium_carterae.2